MSNKYLLEFEQELEMDVEFESDVEFENDDEKVEGIV